MAFNGVGSTFWQFFAAQTLHRSAKMANFSRAKRQDFFGREKSFT